LNSISIVILIGIISYLACIGALFTKDAIQMKIGKIESIENISNSSFLDPAKIWLVKAWNYENPEINEYNYAGCKLERLNPDEWKINFKECE